MAEPFDLDAMVAALREQGEAAPRQADTTRRRVLASLEERTTGRRRRVAVIVAALTLGTGTLSWAATTGRLAPVLASFGLGGAGPSEIGPERGPLERSRWPRGARVAREAAPVVTAASDDARADAIAAPVNGDARAPVTAPVNVDARAPGLAALPAAPEPPVPSPPPSPARRRPRAAARVADDGTAQFRRADELHAHGAPAAALAAWDGYLAAHPTGALALEARYNRALALVRLRRWDDALAALAPFVDGAVTPAGYRQADAVALAAAIERRVAAARKRGAP